MLNSPRVDNFDIFPREWVSGEFYFVQIIERAKDNPDKSGLNGGNSCRILKSYSIETEKELQKRIPLIKEYCEKYKARCYMHPARRSKQAIAQQMVIMLGEYMLHSRHRLERIYDSACGNNTGVEKRWVIDVDTKSLSVLDIICATIRKRSLGKKEMKMYTLPTLNGYHIISTPFDTRILDTYKLDIHKNNPTLLYFF